MLARETLALWHKTSASALGGRESTAPMRQRNRVATHSTRRAPSCAWHECRADRDNFFTTISLTGFRRRRAHSTATIVDGTLHASRLSLRALRRAQVTRAVARVDRLSIGRVGGARSAMLSTNMTTIELEQLSDEALIAETSRMAEVERHSTASLLALLIEVERRRLHLARGHASLFAYCVRTLHFSEQAAYGRITAARAARRFPALLELLAEGALTLSSVGLLAPHLTEENVEQLLDAARCKTSREVERLIACLHPQPDIPASLRALPVQAPTLVGSDDVIAPAIVAKPAAPAPAEPARPRPVIAPIAPKRYLLKLTIGQETHDTLQRVRALLRHSVPDGDLATIMDRALTLLLQQAERTKCAATSRPRAMGVAATTGRHVPAAVRRAVWTRDAGRCAFVGSDGRCKEVGFLEFHHVIPFAAGGATEAENLELRCRAHNAYEAILDFGAEPATRRAPSVTAERGSESP